MKTSCREKNIYTINTSTHLPNTYTSHLNNTSLNANWNNSTHRLCGCQRPKIGSRNTHQQNARSGSCFRSPHRHRASHVSSILRPPTWLSRRARTWLFLHVRWWTRQLGMRPHRHCSARSTCHSFLVMGSRATKNEMLLAGTYWSNGYYQ